MKAMDAIKSLGLARAQKSSGVNWKAIGIGVVVAGALVYPAIRLFRFISDKLAQSKESGEGVEHPFKAFSPSYRGKHKPHHRHAHNGHVGGHHLSDEG